MLQKTRHVVMGVATMELELVYRCTVANDIDNSSRIFRWEQKQQHVMSTLQALTRLTTDCNILCRRMMAEKNENYDIYSFLESYDIML